MFKKYPYPGWLFIALLLWAAATVRFYTLRQMATPKAMTALVSKDFQKRQKALDAFLANEKLVRKIFNDSLTSEEADALSREPFYLYAFRSGYLLQFWNNNTVVGTCNENFPGDNGNGLFRYNGTFYKQCLHPAFLQEDEHLVALFPLRNKYAVQNKYLQSQFLAAEYIPLSTYSSYVKTGKYSYPVTTADKRTLFYLNFIKDDLPRYISDSWMSSLFAAAILVSALWLHLMAVALSRRYAPGWGLAVLLPAMAALIAVVYTVGAPFYFGELPIFRPNLYASNYFFPSLASLLIVLLTLFWLLIFLLFNFKPLRQRTPLKGFDYVAVGAFILLLISCAVAPIPIIRQLVLDSKISFEVANLTAINVYTFLGLATVVLLLCCSTFTIYCCNLRLNNLIRKKPVKYLALAAGLAGYYLLFLPDVALHQLLYASSVFIFLLLFDFFFPGRNRIFSTPSIVTGMVMAVSATLLLHYFNGVKKRVDEQVFVDKIVKQRDEMMEFVFRDIDDSLRKDRLLQEYLAAPTRDDRSYIEEHISTRYFRGQLNRYKVTTYFFDAKGVPVFNADTLSLHSLDTLMNRGTPVGYAANLHYFENARDGRYYLARIPLDSNAGTIGLVFQLKQEVSLSVYPELLEPGKIQEDNGDKRYTYGIYAKRELITQNNDYPFPYYLRSDSMAAGSVRVLEREGYKVNIYKVEGGKRVSIIEQEEQWTERITLFSYVLCTLLLGALVIAVGSLFIRYVFRKGDDRKIIELTLRNRIHFAILGVVMLSFIVIGAVTILVFVDRYDTSNKVTLRTAMQSVERSLQSYFKDRKMPLDETSFHEETQTRRFKNYISGLADEEGLDINVYNSQGTLMATSQEDIYNKALLARIMMPDAYFQMSQKQSALLVQEEHIGKLQYLSSYVPLRNYDGRAVGYINVPFFSSQKQLNYQISNILVALINIYAIVFIISSLLTVGITNWLTKGLHLLIEKFKTINLSENEKIAWAYDDEIGMLLREYNKMVEKVVENAKRLAQSERESAWREMAQQVAHEIKNPLTPMKLNIQYLQQAIEKDHPNKEQLTQNVAATMIEQIDNLSHIATAFSDFAKMPEAAPETIVVNDLLANVHELYSQGTELALQLDTTQEPLRVYADKNQLLRVLNNLVKNALEAIPDDRQAILKITLQKKDHKALVAISDNGKGIDEVTQQKIFSPYFTTKGSGTGLGLAMTKKIVEFWNGRIWFETQADKGTTFFVELPLHNPS